MTKRQRLLNRQNNLKNKRNHANKDKDKIQQKAKEKEKEKDIELFKTIINNFDTSNRLKRVNDYYEPIIQFLYKQDNYF